MWKYTIEIKQSKEILVKKIIEIAAHIEKESLLNNQVGLHTGSMGNALFLFYYSKLFRDNKCREIAYDVLLNIVNKINQSTVNSSTFCTGLSGIIWCFEFLHTNKFIKENPHDIFEDVYDHLAIQMIKYTKENNFDYLHGSMGISLVLINKKKYHKYIEDMIDIVVEKGERKDNTIKWKATNYNGGKEGYNLSLAHGSASILYFFLLAYKNDIRRNLSKIIAYEIINTYFCQDFKSKLHNSILPSVILTNGEVYGSRLAWCYGDVGVCSILLLAAEIFEDEKLKLSVIDIFIKTTKRKTQFETGVVDAGFCHGSIGLAHIYNRIYNSTGVKIFKESAEYWINKTLDLSIHRDGLAGFKSYSGIDDKWIDDTSLLEGISGVGISLISQVSTIKPSWDKCFLLSI